MSTFKYHIESDTRLLIAMKLPRRKFLHLAAIPDSLIRLSLQCAALPKEKTAQRGATSHAAPPNRGSSSNSHLRGTRMPVEEPSTAENSENFGPETTRRLANRRECRTFSDEPDMSYRDGTGWLGM